LKTMPQPLAPIMKERRYSISGENIAPIARRLPAWMKRLTLSGVILVLKVLQALVREDGRAVVVVKRRIDRRARTAEERASIGRLWEAVE